MDGKFTTNQDIILMLSKHFKEYRLATRIRQKEMAEKCAQGNRLFDTKRENIDDKTEKIQELKALINISLSPRTYLYQCRTINNLPLFAVSLLSLIKTKAYLQNLRSRLLI